jgi:glycosyltransferase involved in cell wall biosynthesis
LRSRVLYLSYTGLLQPLGQSQVLQYLAALSADHDITLISYERPEDLADKPRLAEMKAQCEAAGLKWVRLRYHKAPSIPATLYDLMIGTIVSFWIAAWGRIGIVHTRSYVPGLIGLLHKKLAGRKFIFDMRGFWPDERVDGGIWRAGSRPYRVTKALERHLLEGADVVVSLSRAGVTEMEQFAYLKDRHTRFEVIPTCTNMQIFRPLPRPNAEKAFTLGYVGSAGVWYMFPETAACIKVLFEMQPEARLLVINRTEQDYVRDTLSAAGVDLSRVEIRSARYDEVAEQMARMDAAIFFIKPVFSKRASCPTKLGELLACGIPALANSGVGDVAELLLGAKAGVCINRFDEAAYRQGVTDLLALAADPGTADRCINLAKAEFSLESGVERYDAIYRSLAA